MTPTTFLEEREPQDSWREGTRKFMSQFILHCDQQGDCEGCKYDMDAIIEHIQEKLSTARKEEREATSKEWRDALAPLYEQISSLKEIARTISKQ